MRIEDRGELDATSISPPPVHIVIGIAAGIVAGVIGCLVIVGCVFYWKLNYHRNTCEVCRQTELRKDNAVQSNNSSNNDGDIESSCMGGVFSPRSTKFSRLGISFSSCFNGRTLSHECRKEPIFLNEEAPSKSHFSSNTPQRRYSGWGWLSRCSTPGFNVLIGISRDNMGPGCSESLRSSRETDRKSWFIQTTTALTSNSITSPTTHELPIRDNYPDIESVVETQNEVHAITSYIDDSPMGQTRQQGKSSKFLSSVMTQFKFPSPQISVSVSKEEETTTAQGSVIRNPIPASSRNTTESTKHTYPPVSHPASLSSIARSSSSQSIPLAPPPLYCVEDPNFNMRSENGPSSLKQVPQELLERYQPAEKPQLSTTATKPDPGIP